MAPEVLQNQTYDSQADVYSLGVVLFQMIFGVYPFMGKHRNKDSQLKAIKKINFSSFNIEVRAEMKQLLQSMLEINSQTRINFPNLMSHPLIKLDTLLLAPKQPRQVHRVSYLPPTTLKVNFDINVQMCNQHLKMPMESLEKLDETTDQEQPLEIHIKLVGDYKAGKSSIIK